MIRLRCETGCRQKRVNEIADYNLIGSARWMDLALSCARLQARAKIVMGRKAVPLEWIADQEWSESPRALYAAGILDLISWDERTGGRLGRIRRADLSFAAAEALLRCGFLPRCFLPILLADDLLATAGWDQPHSELLHDEFTAWIECGGLAENSPFLENAA